MGIKRGNKKIGLIKRLRVKGIAFYQLLQDANMMMNHSSANLVYKPI